MDKRHGFTVNDPAVRLLRLAQKVFAGSPCVSVTHGGYRDEYLIHLLVPKRKEFGMYMDTRCQILVSGELIHALAHDDSNMRHALARLAHEQIDCWEAARTPIAKKERDSIEAGQLIDDAMAEVEPDRFALDDRIIATREFERKYAVETVELQLAAVKRAEWSLRMVGRLEHGKTWGDMLAEEDR